MAGHGPGDSGNGVPASGKPGELGRGSGEVGKMSFMDNTGTHGVVGTGGNRNRGGMGRLPGTRSAAEACDVASSPFREGTAAPSRPSMSANPGDVGNAPPCAGGTGTAPGRSACSGNDASRPGDVGSASATSATRNTVLSAETWVSPEPSGTPGLDGNTMECSESVVDSPTDLASLTEKTT